MVVSHAPSSSVLDQSESQLSIFRESDWSKSMLRCAGVWVHSLQVRRCDCMCTCVYECMVVIARPKRTLGPIRVAIEHIQRI